MDWVFPPQTLLWAKKQLSGSIAMQDRFDILSAAEYEAYGPYIGTGTPLHVLDLACGLGRVAVYLNKQRPGSCYILADSDGDRKRLRYGWDTNEFYNQFTVTRLFVEANGLVDYRLFDVKHDSWEDLIGWPDLIISMLGIGFHVPLESQISTLHVLAKPSTTLIFGVGGVEDFPQWEEEHDFGDLFGYQKLIPFDCPYTTHEGRILILRSKR